MDDFKPTATGDDDVSGSAWIKKCQTTAKELQLLSHYFKNQFNQKSSDINEVNPSELLQCASEWSRQAATFIEAEAQVQGKNTYLGAKLISSSREDKSCLLTSAIILGKTGYKELSISAINLTLKLDNTRSEEYLEAILAALEPLTSEFDPGKIQTISLREQANLIHELEFNKQATKVVSSAILCHNNKVSRSDLLTELEHLIKVSINNNSSADTIKPQEALTYAKERRKRREKEDNNYSKPLIRTIHHLACTGGTLISKCLASMPDIALVSEVNPFNRYGNKFEPTNPFLLFERSHKNLSKEDIKRNFKYQIQQIIEVCQKDDLDLIIRDHSHTDFCTGAQPSNICPVHDFLQDDYELVSVVSVRHPLDSFLGLVNSGWDEQFRPNTLDEYCKRYLAFLQRYNSLNIIKYETFCNEQTKTMKELCNILKINFLNGFEERFGHQLLSGDSGRRDLTKIEARPRRPIPEGIARETTRSEHYFELLTKLGYAHHPDS